jgi:hypothetical protein
VKGRRRPQPLPPDPYRLSVGSDGAAAGLGSFAGCARTSVPRLGSVGSGRTVHPSGHIRGLSRLAECTSAPLNPGTIRTIVSPNQTMPWKVASPNQATPWKATSPNQASPWKVTSPNPASPWRVAPSNLASPWRVAPVNSASPWRVAPVEPGVAVEGRPCKPGVALEGRPCKPGVALELDFRAFAWRCPAVTPIGSWPLRTMVGPAPWNPSGPASPQWSQRAGPEPTAVCARSAANQAAKPRAELGFFRGVGCGARRQPLVERRYQPWPVCLDASPPPASP